MQSHPAIFFSPENQGHKLETAVNIKNLKKLCQAYSKLKSTKMAADEKQFNKSNK